MYCIFADKYFDDDYYKNVLWEHYHIIQTNQEYSGGQDQLI